MKAYTYLITLPYSHLLCYHLYAIWNLLPDVENNTQSKIINTKDT